MKYWSLGGLAAVLLAGIADASGGDLVIADVRIVDVETGEVGPPQDIWIAEGQIAAITDPGTRETSVALLDGKGAYAIPGLWDSHVHVFSALNEPQVAFDMYLLNGVTGIRDMGGLFPIEEQKRIASAVDSGDMRGPRIVLSGAWVDASPGSWPGMFIADTPQEARSVVREINAQGWAAVKAYSMLSEPVYLALADAAGAAGLPLVGHIPETVVLQTAIGAGQTGMEHWGRVTKACSPEEGDMVDRVRSALTAEDPLQAMIAEMATHTQIVLDTWNAALCERVVADMADAGLAVSPTLVVADFYTGVRPDAQAERLRVLPQAVRERWSEPDFRLQAMTDDLRAIAEDSIALDHRTFLLAHGAGVPLLAATDASFANPFIFHGYSLLDELDLYVRIGLTPRAALFAATVAPARFLALPDQDGRVAEGRRADIVLLRENPLEGLATLRTPQAVIANGWLFDRADLDAIRRALIAGGD